MEQPIIQALQQEYSKPVTQPAASNAIFVSQIK
jgi:hypothetical protein